MASLIDPFVHVGVNVAHRQTGRKTDRQTGKQADRLTDGRTDQAARSPACVRVYADLPLAAVEGERRFGRGMETHPRMSPFTVTFTNTGVFVTPAA